jgi:hypothetical protein
MIKFHKIKVRETLNYLKYLTGNIKSDIYRYPVKIFLF